MSFVCSSWMGVCGGKLCVHVHPALDYVRYSWILPFLNGKNSVQFELFHSQNSQIVWFWFCCWHVSFKKGVWDIFDQEFPLKNFLWFWWNATDSDIGNAVLISGCWGGRFWHCCRALGAQIRSLEVQLAHASAQLRNGSQKVPDRRQTMAPPTTTAVRNRRKETTFEAAGMIIIFWHDWQNGTFGVWTSRRILQTIISRFLHCETVLMFLWLAKVMSLKTPDLCT